MFAASEPELVAAGLSAGAASAVASFADWRQAAERALVAAKQSGASLVTWDERGYPERLCEIPDPPPCLYVRGEYRQGDALAVAVVGARGASTYGRATASRLGAELARAGFTVVSGLAFGIDAAAHEGALAAGGRTIAVLGTGVDVIYPRAHASLAARIAVRGALISEFPPGSPPRREHFPRRNRLIAGLGLGTVVVEAAEHSGSLITARLALEQGREVFAVPGPAGAELSRGTHRLLRQGARLVESAEDVIEELAPALGARLAAARAQVQADLGESERRVLAALGGGALHVDEVVRRAALPASVALEVLLALELRGLVRQLPGMYFGAAS